MSAALIQVLLYGVLAGLSALAFAATLAVMPGGRLKTLGFGAGFVGAQALTCSAFVTIGVAAAGSTNRSHPGLRAALALALAVALVALALRLRRRPPNADMRPTPDESSVTNRQTPAARPSAFPDGLGQQNTERVEDEEPGEHEQREDSDLRLPASDLAFTPS